MPPPIFIDLQPPPDCFLEDVLSGLAASPKALSPKYFYDARGSALFEAICELPEYYPTRTELALTRDSAAEIAALVGPGRVLIEFGSGASTKTAILLRALAIGTYLPVDIAADALRAAARRLATEFSGLQVAAVCADYMRPLDAAALARWPGRRLVYFPGSTIGNLMPAEAADFLVRARALAGDGGAMLVGVDLKKDPQRLHEAYNDAQGITAEFNLNLLRRINRELGADFDPGCFRHVACYDASAGRIEMHLESTCTQAVNIGGHSFVFAAGERLHTENSYKYTVAEFRQLAQSAGFGADRVWVDSENLFSIHLLRA